MPISIGTIGAYVIATIIKGDIGFQDTHLRYDAFLIIFMPDAIQWHLLVFYLYNLLHVF